jgi:hypothetical protein
VPRVSDRMTYRATIIPEGPGTKREAVGTTPKAAVREVYRAYLAWSRHEATISEEELDDYLKDVKIRNGCIYDGDTPVGDVGPA